MANAGNSSLSSVFNKVSLDDHAELLKASETALKTSKSDIQAQHIKVVSLLKLDKYDEVVKFIESSGETLREKAGLEYAYALYKLGRLSDAAQIASKVQGQVGAQHVEAQARYKVGDYERTAQIYKILGTKEAQGEEYNLRINQGAIDAQGQWLGIMDPSLVKKATREDLEAFETAYNAACGSIARGELGQAEVLLKRAKELCKHADELTDEQKQEEILSITVQQVYVLYRQGKSSEADTMAEEINVDEIPDLATRKVAASNRLLSQKHQTNPFLAHKAFHSTPHIPESDQLFSYQSIPLTSNENTVDLKSFKYTGLAQTTKNKLSKFPATSTSSEALLLSAFNAAALARNEVGKAAINNVLPELERRPNDIGLIMTLVQMYTMTGNTTSAIELMQALFKRLESSIAENEQDARNHPGLVSILVGLYRLQGRKSHIKQELAKSASYWRHKSKPPMSLLRAAGVSLLQSSTDSDISIAAEIFSKLYEQQPDDKATIAGYVASHVLSDPKSVEALANELTPVSKLISGIDVDALESQGVPQSTNALAIAQAQSNPSRKRTATTSAADNKPKRIRKSRLPKDFDPASNTKPDPERWLPLRDRSSYRPPKGKKKGKKGDDRTQGGLVSEELDVSKQPQSKGGEVVTGNSGGGGKKKKGKGKK